MKKFCYIFLTFAALLSFNAKADLTDSVGAPVKTLRLTYRIGQNNPDMTLLANRKAYNDILREVARRRASNSPVAVEFVYFCAPGAENFINTAIGQNRALELQKALKSNTSLPDSAFIATDGGAGWAELYMMVKNAPDIKYKDLVLEIIKGDPDKRISRIKKIDGGKTYSYLHENIFPALRGEIRVSIGPAKELADARRTDRNFSSGYAWRQTVTECVDCSCDAAVAAASSAPAKVVYVNADGTPAPDYGRWAFKTNIIYDCIATPSLEVEYHFKPQWSVNIEYEMGWWKKKDKNKSFEIAEVSPEVRWWFKSPSPAAGYYLGAFPGFAWYDFENGGTGHRGHGVFGGISFGFVRPLSAKWSFEAGVGVGYLNLRYKDYEPVDDHHVYQRTKSTGYFGPLKVKLAVVWHPWGRKYGAKLSSAK